MPPPTSSLLPEKIWNWNALQLVPILQLNWCGIWMMKWFLVDIVKKIPDRKIQTINKELGLQFHVWHCPFPKTIMVLGSVVWQPIQPLRMTSPYRPSNHWPFIVSLTFEQFFIFWISKIFQISGSTTTVKKRRLMVIKNSFLTRVPFYLSLHFILYFTAFLCVLHDISLPSI